MARADGLSETHGLSSKARNPARGELENPRCQDDQLPVTCTAWKENSGFEYLWMEPTPTPLLPLQALNLPWGLNCVLGKLTGKVNYRSDDLCGPVHFPALIHLQSCIRKGTENLGESLTKSPEEGEGSGSTTRQLAEQ